MQACQTESHWYCSVADGGGIEVAGRPRNRLGSRMGGRTASVDAGVSLSSRMEPIVVSVRAVMIWPHH